MKYFWLAYTAAMVSACTGDTHTPKITGDTILTPLTHKAGDASNGKVIFYSRDAGHCVLCHQIGSLNVEFQGNVGPDLSNVGDKLSPTQIRLRIVDYDAFRPGTVMPSYFRKTNLHKVGQAYENQTVLSAQDIEDLIAYLSGLEEG